MSSESIKDVLDHPGFFQQPRATQGMSLVIALSDVLEEIGRGRKMSPQWKQQQRPKWDEALSDSRLWEVLHGQNLCLSILVPMCFVADRPDVLSQVLAAYDWTNTTDGQPETVLKNFLELSLHRRYKTPGCQKVLALDHSGSIPATIERQGLLLKYDAWSVCDSLIKSKQWMMDANNTLGVVQHLLLSAQSWDDKITTLQQWQHAGVPITNFTAVVFEALAQSRTNTLTTIHVQQILDLGFDPQQAYDAPRSCYDMLKSRPSSSAQLVVALIEHHQLHAALPTALPARPPRRL